MNASYRQIWKIAYPIIIGSLAQTLISVTDTAFMGRVSETAQAAIGLVSVYYLILFMIGYSYTKGTQILVARRLGEKNDKAAGEIFDNSMLVIVLMSAVLFIFLRFFSDVTLGLLITDPFVREAGSQYLSMRSFGVFFGFAGSVFLAFFMGLGAMRILLVSIILMSVSNIALNYVLIFGKLGFPEMGISGAAMASNIAEFIASIVFFIYTIWKGLSRKFGLFRTSTYSLSVIKSMTSLSLPIVLQTIIGLTAWMLFFTFVEKMGERSLAISSVAKSIYILFGIPAWGFSAATNTVISNLMGQNKPMEVVSALKKIVILSAGFTAFLTLSLAAWPRFFLGLYTDNVEVINEGVPIVFVCIVALWGYAISIILFHGVVSTGSTKISLIIEIIVIFLYLLFLWWVFNLPQATLTIVWTSEIFYWAAIALASLVYLMTGHWKKMKI